MEVHITAAINKAGRELNDTTGSQAYGQQRNALYSWKENGLL